LKKKTNRIVVCCTQSSKKLYKCLNTKKDISHNNILVWFDEAHWGFEEWFNTNNIKEYMNNKFKQYWFEDNSLIKYRISTSASSNNDILKKYSREFGTVLDNIKVNQLIIEKWLCPLRSYIFEFNKDIGDIDILNTVLTEFKNNKKKLGFCFHNKQKNAFHLFYKHITMYIKGQTDIRPFLLISEKYSNINIENDIDDDSEDDNGEPAEESEAYDSEDDINIANIKGKHNKDPEINEIIKQMEQIKKDLTDNKLFYNFQNEEDYRNSPNQIAYVVKQFSLGYDNKYIDFIAFIDRKSSYKDIIQSIGRGLRSDEEGDNGKNKDKELLVLIPIFIEDCDSDEQYNKNALLKIKEVLQYLIFDIELDYNDLFIKKKKKPNSKKKKKYDKSIQYLGTEEMRMKLLKLIQNIPKIKSYEKILELLKYNKINCKKDYLQFIKINNTFELPENLKIKKKQIYWYDTYNDEDKLQFYNKQECIKKIKKIKKNPKLYKIIEYEDDNDVINKFLHNQYNKIPNRHLDMFYGGTLDEYLVFN